MFLDIKKASVTIFLLRQKPKIIFCGTTRFGAKRPLIPYTNTNIYAPLVTGGDPVRHYLAVLLPFLLLS